MGYIYFDGIYTEYYSKLTENNLSATQNLKNSVESVKSKMASLNGSVMEWSGKSNESYNGAVSLMMSRFDEIQRELNDNLIPACESADKLVPLLKEFETIDKETAAAKEKCDGYNNPQEKITCQHYTYDSVTGKQNGVEHPDGDHNPVYDEYIKAKEDYETKLAKDEK